MGIIPLCFKSGQDAETVGLTGHEQMKKFINQVNYEQMKKFHVYVIKCIYFLTCMHHCLPIYDYKFKHRFVNLFLFTFWWCS